MEILNCKIDQITQKEVFEKIPEFLNSDGQHRIVTLNAEYILEAQKDKKFQDIINSADLVVTDGIGPIWAAKFLSLPVYKNKILRYPQVVLQYILTGESLVFNAEYCKTVMPERVSGVGLVKEISNFKFQISKQFPNPNFKFQKIFLLGGFNNIGKQIQEMYPNTIVGTYEGSPDEKDDEKIREIINQAKPNILFVAYGNPASKQEKWISRNLKCLPTVKIAMGVGGSFDFLSENIKRAPEWMQRMGIEWLFRLIRQPKRYKRIFNAVIVFSFKILKCKLINHTPS